MKKLSSLRIIVLLTSLLCGVTPPASAGERWVNQMNASLVLGQADFDSDVVSPTSSGMNNPWDVAIDPTSGKVFVADTNHNRILRFASFPSLQNGADAEAVLGQVNFTTISSGLTDSKMSAPRGLVVDSDGILWVADFRNHRVLRFDDASEKTTGAAADGVLGKADFTSGDPELSQTGIGFPYTVAVDAAGNLFVGSSANNRVLMFADAANLMAGSAASLVFGQEDFDSNLAATTRDGMTTPIGLAVDDSGNLFVADSSNHRVLRFDAAATKSTGADADAVLGQPDFVTAATATGAAGMNSPRAVAITSDGLLWVADISNHRLLGFPDVLSLTDGSAASFFLGQPDFDTNVAGLSQVGLNTPRGLALDSADRLYVADTIHNRVVVFEKGRFQPDSTIGVKSPVQRGRNRYNSSGSGQTENAKTEGKEVKLTPKVENDGNVTDSYQIRSKGSSSQFRIKLFLQTGGRKNISASSKTGKFTSQLVAPGASLTLEHRTKPKGSFRQKRATIKAWIDASSATDGEKDRVVGKIKNRP
jgi:DNA-binding beta-propeller fold protein YncE